MNNKTNINYDIAIYGTGPASIFFLEQFKNSKLKIAIIESGNFNTIKNIDTIDKITGPIKFNSNGNKERVESFFGTCSLWNKKGVGGKLQKFDKKDIDENFWPFNYDALNKYYQLGINNISDHIKLDLKNDFKLNDNLGFLESFKKNFRFKSDSSTLSYNFNKLYKSIKKNILKKHNFHFYSDTKLLKVKFNFEENKIDFSECINEDKIIKFFAKNHVLSCGCLENNRIVLNSLNTKPDYLKEYNIGKFISFHPTLNLGNFKINKSLKLSNIKKIYNPLNKIIFLQSENQKKYNSALNLSLSYYRSNNFLYDKIFFNFINYIDLIDVSLQIEHKANINSQIYLSNKKTKDDLFKINIHTEFSDENRTNMEKSIKYHIDLIKNIKILDKYNFNTSNLNINYETSNHHHGGLIFGNKKNIPVNQDFLLKDFKNFYINGSALFPSSSIYGPTLTIIACSIMLSDIIKNKLNI